MLAAVLRKPGEAVQVEDVDLAGPTDGQVRVRVEAAGVCHSDLHYMTGDLTSKLPVVLGHEGVGRVIEVGPGVVDVAVGDRVVFTWRPRCGRCRFCLDGRPTLCVGGGVQRAAGGLLDGSLRLSADGKPVHHLMGVSCFAEECVVFERSVIKISEEIPRRIAAIVGCAVITGVGTALNAASGSTGRPVAVFGAGGVGLSAVMGLHLVGAHPIIAIDTDQAKLDLARMVGASHTLLAGDAVVDQIRELTGGGADWTVDAVGRPVVTEQALAALGPGGTLIAAGLTDVSATFAVPTNLLVQQQQRVIGSLYGSANPAVQLPQILELYRAGRLPLDRLAGAEYPLDQVNEAYAALASGSLGRATVVPGPA